MVFLFSADDLFVVSDVYAPVGAGSLGRSDGLVIGPDPFEFSVESAGLSKVEPFGTGSRNQDQFPAAEDGNLAESVLESLVMADIADQVQYLVKPQLLLRIFWPSLFTVRST